MKLNDKKKETLIIQAVNLSSRSLERLYQIIQRINGEFRKNKEAADATKNRKTP